MWSQRSRSRRRGNRCPGEADAGTATLEYVGMIALAAMLVVAVCGAMQVSALSGVASNAVQCVTTFACGHSGSGPVTNPGSVPGRTTPAGTNVATGQPPGAQQPPGAAATQRQLPGAFAGAGGNRGASLWDPVGPPYSVMWGRLPGPPWQRYPVGPPQVTPPWNPIGMPLPPRVIWCEINVGCY